MAFPFVVPLLSFSVVVHVEVLTCEVICEMDLARGFMLLPFSVGALYPLPMEEEEFFLTGVKFSVYYIDMKGK